MSYIHRFNVNHYRPCENLKNLFEELVIQPYNNHPPTQAWKDVVSSKDTDYHRYTILDRVRTDFDEPFNGLSPEDKVLLYCVHYMPMHLYSSYHVFTKHLLPHITEKVVFIDIGCGPLTSGIAFWAAARQCNITWIGVDRSQTMLHKAAEINKYGPDNYNYRFFSNERLIREFSRLPGLLDNYITLNDQTQIIFNFCYVLASRTLNINALSDVFYQIVNKYKTHNMVVVYQNPKPPNNITPEMSFLHKKWFTLKQNFQMFNSQVTESNIETFRYNGLNMDFDVYYDILYNINMTQWSTKHGTTITI